MTKTDHEAILREMKKKKAVLTLPGIDDVIVRGGTYHTGYEELGMDIYYPPAATGAVPVVLVAFGYPDPPGNIRQYGPMTSWARLFAASGMAAVIYATNECAENIHALLAHIRANADGLGLDSGRIALWAASASGSVALAAVMRDRSLKGAALLCGYTMDLASSTAVADAAKQFLFVNACAGKSVDDLPDNVPLLFVRAGREQSPGLNEALDAVVARALARNLPVTLMNHATGAHSFAFDEDSELSREMIRRVLEFLAFHLK
jgi:hypothetical protein